MGNCCGTQRNKAEEYQLKSTKNNKSSGQTLGGSNVSGDNSPKDAMLIAAEKRKADAEKRGVLKEGGKLSKQLAEQQYKKPEYNSRKEDELVWD